MTLVIVLLILFLVGAFFLQTTNTAFRVLEQSRSYEQLKSTDAFFLYRALQRLFFKERELEILFFSISCTKHLLRFAYVALASALFIAELHLYGIIAIVIFAAFSLLIGDFAPRFWATKQPDIALRITAPIASIFLIIASPISYAILLLGGRHLTSLYVERVREPVTKLKEKIIEMVEQAGVQSTSDADEKWLFQSVAGLRDRLAREIMVPRVDMECLEASTSVRDAARHFDSEGYSRFPVYNESVDQIVGVLLYKDVARLLLQGDNAALDASVRTIVKPVPFVPETSHVTHVMREFREKQTHLAIVVDEYGGTEGLVTIEDCLEEIVGEIADETDEAEEVLFHELSDGSYTIDARMGVAEIEMHLGIKIPQEGDYDTIGGYAFHCAGEIPPQGMQIHQDEFDLEILESTERCVETLRLIPRRQ